MSARDDKLAAALTEYSAAVRHGLSGKHDTGFFNAILALATDPTGVSFDDRMAATRATHLFDVPFGWAVLDCPWRLTPLGLAVRAVLEKEMGDG